MEDSSEENSEDESEVSDGSQKRVCIFNHQDYSDELFLSCIIYN